MFHKHKKILSKKFSDKPIELDSIERINEDPRPNYHFEWSFGSTIERGYFYKVKYKQGENYGFVFCLVVTFLDLFTLKTSYFLKDGKNTKQVYLSDFSNWVMHRESLKDIKKH